MRYYLIAGEASGDLHAANLITALIKQDHEAQFRFFGGDEMTTAAGDKGVRVKHYRELAYMGFVPVLLHLPTILRNMQLCKRDIMQWQPNVVIFVDYAGFNLSIAKYLHKQPNRPRLYYYISPKIWAWKEYRIKNFRRDIDEMFCILPFEKDFFEKKHHYPVHYVGNPTADEVRKFQEVYTETTEEFCQRNGLITNKPIIALLPGSRQQEIRDNLPTMLRAATIWQDEYQLVVAGATGQDSAYYSEYLQGVKEVNIVFSETYKLLSHSTAALVTSGTATLETALFRIPQVVCYRTPLPWLCRWGFNHILKVRYISLVNLIANKEVVPELFADRFCEQQIREALASILPNGAKRKTMLSDYETVVQLLGSSCTPDNTANRIVTLLNNETQQ